MGVSWYICRHIYNLYMGHHGSDHMVIGFTSTMQSVPIIIKVGGHHGLDGMVVACPTICAISAYHH
jgi:hypothetical protein